MGAWPNNPVIYEINALAWLNGLGRRLARPVTLASVPAAEWDALSALGFDAVWLMGVWERSPRGIDIATANEKLMEDFRRALPDLRPEDIAGSPYCVRRYEVDASLGGPAGLAAARDELGRRGMKLLLDFVPNHVAPDHPWTTEHPEYFIAGDGNDLRTNPESYLLAGESVLACGKDPYFPAWPDVAQLNAFNPGLRAAAIATLDDIAGRCDGVRCDMAMLFLNSVFEKTWDAKAGGKPEGEYWREAIAAVKERHPDFIFIAEAYWDLEWELQNQGFDFCYDKRLYDRLERDTAENVRLHLGGDPSYEKKLLRFIENHDEPRAASAFPSPKDRAAAVVTATVPGAKLFHEGQFEGRKTRLPVFLARFPDEPADTELRRFYQTLLAAVTGEGACRGEWRLCECEGWPDNQSRRNILAWSWRNAGDRCLVAVNYSAAPAQAMVRPPWDDLAGRKWTTLDVMGNQPIERDGDDLAASGLFVDLPGWGFHVFGQWAAKQSAGESDA